MTNQQSYYDEIILVYCSNKTQEKRVLKRNKMTLQLLKKINEAQMSVSKKIGKSSIILNTDEIYDIKEKNKSLINWIWDLNFDDSLSAAYKNRLDLKIKNQDISINKNKSLSILSGKKPNFTIYNQYTLSKSWGENDVTTNPDFKNENKKNLNSVGMKFNWNIFDGGLIRQNYISSKNRTEELQNELNGQLDDTRQKKVPVRIKELKEELFYHFIEQTGKINSNENVLVSAEMGGLLTDINA